MKKIALYVFLFAIVAASCKKYRCPETIYCSAGYNFLLVGYDSSEFDTVILRAYKADNTFSQLIDTALIADTIVTMGFNGPQYVWLPLFGNYQDTFLNGSLQLSTLRGVDIDTSFVPYDWEVYIPKDNRTYRISSIKMGGRIKQTEESCDQNGNSHGVSCTQYLAAFTIDGTEYHYSSPDFMNYYNFIFLKK